MQSGAAEDIVGGIGRRAFIASLGGAAAVAAMSAEAKADALEHALADNLGPVGRTFPTVAQVDAQIPTRHYRRGVGNVFIAEQGTVDVLAPMPEKPKLADFIRLRFQSTSNHCLQSATQARKRNMDEDIVFACLVHDLSMAMMRANHGFWSAQLFEPYVSEKVAFAIRHHAALRFFPDAETGYTYPDIYREMFGEDYVPPPHVQREFAMVRKHRWYMAARLVTVNDLYAFDPNAQVSLDPFEDVIGRHFRQPAEGLGFDSSPSAHMWRTLFNPDSPL
ncbi:hypothetical protein M2336_000268 [Sphingobium sp. B1D7B]|uniref:hypothetical protein n=1 Tax=unclassified Sphingobium TaxID=2611147 RepID=UPI00222426D6|nr:MULTISPECIES: hypothetical protein [unclassified Sphingobium]MCW2382868.1 hypothetical protein [Sphingobium sp. B2D3B]MCW2391884.1 hypothetical protein [Sphingobium sp. B11D3A]MCW2396959.1 hypothetical protein [Sphingobium sp. B2D3C]MCW2403639.1 hypothetical protein [Sphingobium sp. B1D7B]